MPFANLKEEIKFLEGDVERLSAMEQAVKIVLNGGYGATGAVHFRWYDETIAEGITATGQIVIRYITKCINWYINDQCGTTGIDRVVSSDTDSVTGSTIISINGKNVTIEDYFNSVTGVTKRSDHGNIVKEVKSKDMTYSVDKDGNLNENRVNYVMKHDVEKRMFRIKHKGKSVTVTEDHSVIVKFKDTGKIASIKPGELDKKLHLLINIVRSDTDKTDLDEDAITEIIDTDR